MSNHPIDVVQLQKGLSDLLSQLRAGETAQLWYDVESTSQAIANALRVNTGPDDYHTVLGQSALPSTLTSLFLASMKGVTTPNDPRTSVVTELLRIAANLCMDHDDNRAHLLDVGFPQAVVSLLEGYVEVIPAERDSEPLPLSLSHLKVVRTAIGVLLNASLGYDPVKFRLISLEAPLTILKLSTSIYPPGAWITRVTDPTQESTIDPWTTRSTISTWAWRIISELKDEKDSSLQIFTQDVLPLLIPPLAASVPPFSLPLSTIHISAPLFATLLQADFEALQESCMLLESLSLDVEDVRLSLARGLFFPAEHGGTPCLSAMLDFIEKGDYLPLWSKLGDGERKRREHAFDICKAAMVKAVVEVTGEQKNEDVLWDDSEPEKPGGEFVCRMVEWIKKYASELETTDNGAELPSSNEEEVQFGRDDLIICASLSLGNLARRESHTAVLLSPPHSLAPILTTRQLLSPTTDLKLKHAIISLLKHLAQSSPQSGAIYRALGDAHVVQRLVSSGVWDEKVGAMAEFLQVSAIGVVKRMCSANIESTFALVLPSEDSSLPTGLYQIFALIKRSDTVTLKSEGTRVLVNVIRSLWRPTGTTPVQSDTPITVNGDTSNEDPNITRKRQECMRAVLTPECALALASLIGRSGKYPILVNEGVFAMTLLSLHRTGASLVLAAITAPLPFDAPPTAPTSASASTSSEVGSPVVASPTARHRLPTARRALDMLISVVRNVDNLVNFPAEVRINVCTLLLQLGKTGSGEHLMKVKETARPTFEKFFETSRGKDSSVDEAVKKVLDAWA